MRKRAAKETDEKESQKRAPCVIKAEEVFQARRR